MNLLGPDLTSSGVTIKVIATNIVGSVESFAVINGIEMPVRITLLPHGLASIQVTVPQSAQGDVLIRISDANGHRSHTILIV